jgi:hypothetical protein
MLVQIVPKGQQDSAQGVNPGNAHNNTVRPERAAHIWNWQKRNIIRMNRLTLAPFQGASLDGTRFPGLKP